MIQIARVLTFMADLIFLATAILLSLESEDKFEFGYLVVVAVTLTLNVFFLLT